MVDQCTDDQLRDPAFLAGLSAVVFTQSDRPLDIGLSIRNHARRLLNYDCLVILRPGSEELSRQPTIIANTIDNLHLPATGIGISSAVPPLPHVAFYTYEIPWLDISNIVADNPLGAAPNLALKVTPDAIAEKLNPDSLLLIGRAFSDCAEVHLVPLDGGRSGANVYRAYAELNGVHGQWPQPYFVKIDQRARIFAEYEAYEQRVDPYIPFHLGPHLIRERCCLGANMGIIVGDYVEESESLRDCACDGRASAAIACLFDRTLLGWHRSPREEQDTTISAGLLSYFPTKIGDSRLARAKALGAELDLSELSSLFSRCNSKPVLVGPIHGDLHAANVRVRATDAIVIDFYAHRDFPLVYDAACLEASLLVEGFPDRDWNLQEWLDSLAPLYERRLFREILPHPNPRDCSAWFHSCIRQIRRYAREWQGADHQYAATLALALLRKAVKDKHVSGPEADRRASAYVFAERVLKATFGDEKPLVLEEAKAS